MKAALFSALFTLALVPSLSFADEAAPSPQARSVEAGGTFSLSRSWREGSQDKTDYGYISGHVLKLGEHFHYGPALSFSRISGDGYSSNSSSYGLLGKYTLENIQTADATPFLTLGLYRSELNQKHYKDHGLLISGGAGYEKFLSSFVAVQAGVYYEKDWNKSFSNRSEDSKYSDHDSSSSVDMRIGLATYF